MFFRSCHFKTNLSDLEDSMYTLIFIELVAHLLQVGRKKDRFKKKKSMRYTWRKGYCQAILKIIFR